MLAAHGVHHDQQSSVGIGAKRDEALLADSVGILDRHRHQIVQRFFGLGEADAVLGMVQLGLERIEFNGCFRIMHILYIYCKR